jgi:hypothetical protein
MSAQDAKRFVDSLKSNPDWIAGIKAAGGGLAGIVAVARQQGYDVSADDAKAYLVELAKRQADDAKVSGVAGGQGGVAVTSTVQSVVVTGPTVAVAVITGVPTETLAILVASTSVVVTVN